MLMLMLTKPTLLQWKSSFFLLLLHVNCKTAESEDSSFSNRHRRKHRAFDLVRIEKMLDDSSVGLPSSIEPGQSRTTALGHHGESFREGAITSSQPPDCRSRCSDQLRMGLDMVKAHAAFGSIGVPSVEDQNDLRLFCKLDSENDRCLLNCGYEIQFNMRNYICKEHFSELCNYLECYTRSSARLKQRCGEKRCGPYKELVQISSPGISQRCKTLTCDLGCIRKVLNETCSSTLPGDFLLNYTKAQIHGWLQIINVLQADTIPLPCQTILKATIPSVNSIHKM